MAWSSQPAAFSKKWLLVTKQQMVAEHLPAAHNNHPSGLREPIVDIWIGTVGR